MSKLKTKVLVKHIKFGEYNGKCAEIVLNNRVTLQIPNEALADRLVGYVKYAVENFERLKILNELPEPPVKPEIVSCK